MSSRIRTTTAGSRASAVPADGACHEETSGPHAPAGLFVSHGAPLVAIEESPARDFLGSLGARLRTPKAILVATAHWETAEPRVAADAHPATIHDFRGFPDALHRLAYPAPGDPALARRVEELLRGAGLAARAVERGGRDHGSWIPLLLAWPEATIPVVELSVQSGRDARWHFDLGRALSPLVDENVLIVGSGAATHDLRRYFARLTAGVACDAGPSDPRARAFAEWLAGALADGDLSALLEWWTEAPFAQVCHPTPEHFLPLFVALGAAAGAGDAGTFRACRLHAGFDRGILAMDAYAFFSGRTDAACDRRS